MKKIEFRLPSLGEGVAEAQVTKILVTPTQLVQEYQPIFEVMTDKATIEIPAPAQGRIHKILVSDGDTYPINAPLVEILPTDRVSSVDHTIINALLNLSQVDEVDVCRKQRSSLDFSRLESELAALRAASEAVPLQHLGRLPEPALLSLQDTLFAVWYHLGRILLFEGNTQDPVDERNAIAKAAKEIFSSAITELHDVASRATKPRVFLGATNPHRVWLDTLAKSSDKVEWIPWSSDDSFASQQTSITLRQLQEVPSRYDHAVFLLGDDHPNFKTPQQMDTHDLVLVTLGVFVGCLGVHRVSLIASKSTRLTAWLLGMEPMLVDLDAEVTEQVSLLSRRLVEVLLEERVSS